ncbi:membrane protein [Halanaerocella petrolearia]
MKLDRYLQVTVTYIGAIIGAGFASGQEILQFFVSYGPSGLLGIILSGFLFIFLGIAIGLVGYHIQLVDYQSLFYRLGGKVIGLLADLFLTLFLLGSLIVMLAGCKEIFNHFFNWPINLGLILTIITIVITNYYGLDGVMKLNTILIPILILISIVVVINLTSSFELNSSHFSLNWMPISSALIYSGYNLVLGMAILLPLTAKVEKKELIWGIFTGGLILGIIAFLIGYILLDFFSSVVGSEIPMLHILKVYKISLYYIYALVLWLAMITTASCNLYGLVTRLEAISKFRKSTLLIIILFFILPVIQLSFSQLVEFVYPWLGKISLSLVVLLIVSYGVQKVYKGSGNCGKH